MCRPPSKLEELLTNTSWVTSITLILTLKCRAAVGNRKAHPLPTPVAYDVNSSPPFGRKDLPGKWLLNTDKSGEERQDSCLSFGFWEDVVGEGNAKDISPALLWLPMEDLFERMGGANKCCACLPSLLLCCPWKRLLKREGNKKCKGLFASSLLCFLRALCVWSTGGKSAAVCCSVKYVFIFKKRCVLGY